MERSTKKIKKVGVGAYGSVFLAENTETKELVAIKTTARAEDPVLGGFPLSLIREIMILKRCQHENIVKIHEVAQTPSGEPLIVMEYCQSSLLELLNSRQHGLSFSEVKYVIRQILDATRHMHDKGILHRDLATKNVLFNLSGEIKVCDFGISRMSFGQDPEYGFLPATKMEDPNMIVSIPYRAIELLLGQRAYGPALDVWAAGCILGEILLCQGGKRRTFFGGDPEGPGGPNKTPQQFVEEIFSILGKPTEKRWPRFSDLPLYRTSFDVYLRSSSKLEVAYRDHNLRGCDDERACARAFFTVGAGKCVMNKYSLSENCFDLLGGLLCFDPQARLSPGDALSHAFFTEKPLPEWHKWHWELASKDIARGGDMRKQSKDGADEAQTLLRHLSQDTVPGEKGASEKAPKSAKEQHMEALRERANEKKQVEEKRKAIAAAEKAMAAQKTEQLPPGWTKHWSSSKQRYYYHDKSTAQNSWSAPKK